MLRARVLFVVPVACAACTFTGLANYDILTCASPTGTTSQAAPIAGGLVQNPDFTFTSSSGANAIAAFVADGNGGLCVQGVRPTGYIGSGCSFFGGTTIIGMSLAPRQPWAVPLGGGYAAAMVATTAPCTGGQIWFEYDAQAIVTYGSQGECTMTTPTVASLPSLAALNGGTTAIAAWYETSIETRTDPIQSCGSATAAPLVVATVTVGSINGPTTTFGTPVTLTSQSTSIRPPATLLVGSRVVVAAPDGNGVSIWTVDGSTTTAPPPVSVPGLATARAVSIASDGAGNLAIVAEIGCAPQSIELAIGPLAGPFTTTTVVPKGNSAVVQPTVAWAATHAVPGAPQNSWAVSWIAVSGGAHALAMRFDSSGTPLQPGNQPSALIDPGTAATGASVTSDGTLLAYVPGSPGSFVNASLGCLE